MIDLHIHTNASDGSTSPKGAIDEAMKAGLKTIAFADHETTAGYSLVKDFCLANNVTIIPGVELLTFHKGKEIHLLGYFMDVESLSFQKDLEKLRDARNQVAWDTVEKMKGHGFKITWEEVISTSTLGGPISKGHIMHAIYQAGYIKDTKDGRQILTKYLNAGGLAYTPYNYSFAEGVDLIKRAGGLPVLAHPGLIGDDSLIPELLELGVQGMEVYYYYFNNNRQELIDKYEAMAIKSKLFMTGGSDYHGIYAPVPLGEIQVPESVLTTLFQLGNKHK